MFLKRYSLACSFPSPQKSRREAVGTLASQPMGSGQAAASYMETRSPLNARRLLSWWEKEWSRARRTTSGRATSRVVCVSTTCEGLASRYGGRGLCRRGGLDGRSGLPVSSPCKKTACALFLSARWRIAEPFVWKDETSTTISKKNSWT